MERADKWSPLGAYDELRLPRLGLKAGFRALVVPLWRLEKNLYPVMPGIYLGALWGIVLVCVGVESFTEKNRDKGAR